MRQLPSAPEIVTTWSSRRNSRCPSARASQRHPGPSPMRKKVPVFQGLFSQIYILAPGVAQSYQTANSRPKVPIIEPTLAASTQLSRSVLRRVLFRKRRIASDRIGCSSTASRMACGDCLLGSLAWCGSADCGSEHARYCCEQRHQNFGVGYCVLNRARISHPSSLILSPALLSRRFFLV